MTGESVAPAEDLWAPFRYFLGEWRGMGTGKPGVSQVEWNYRLILQDQFIRVQSRSVYRPQQQNPGGEIHHEVRLFSHDRSKRKSILPEFHVEGFVNQYILEDAELDGRMLAMTSKAIENIPPGWQARTTYEILNDGEFRETFELARPGQDWVCLITNKLRRATLSDGLGEQQQPPVGHQTGE